jgi:acetyl esterase/lipase
MNRRTAAQWAAGLMFAVIAAAVVLYPPLQKDYLPLFEENEDEVVQAVVQPAAQIAPLGSAGAGLRQQMSLRSEALLAEVAVAADAATDEGPPAKAFEVESIKDVAYYDGPDADKVKHKLDLYLPKDKKDYPVLFFVHGGAWRFGDKNFFGVYSAIGERFAKHGIGAAVINYRLSPKVEHPEHIKDVARAFAWTYKNIAKHGGRADQIFVCGHSAGGHLVALLASDESYLKAHELTLKAIKGAIPMSGVYAIPEWFMPEVFGKEAEVKKQAGPLEHVKEGLPPFCIVYAEHDMPFCGKMSNAFCTALKDKKCTAEAVEIKKRDHMTIIGLFSRENDPALRAVTAFIEKQLEQK